MNRHLAPLVFIIALAATQSFAREPQAPPSPVANTAVSQNGMIKEGAKGNSIYIGHYGESFEFPYGWTADVELQGATEAIYIHRKSHDDFGRNPFQPKKSDYRAENFAPMGLMELIVIPKNAPGSLNSLQAIRRAKELELKQADVDYKISDVQATRWPQGSFHVEARRPYRLLQTYAESSNEFYILTGGGRLEVGEYNLSKDQTLDYEYANTLVRQGLGKYLSSIHRKSSEEVFFRPETRVSNDFAAPFKLPRLRLAWGLFCAVTLILSFWPGTSSRIRRIRLFAWSLLLFSNLTALTAFLSIFIPVYAGDVVWKNSAAAGLISVLLVPGISGVAAKIFGSAHPRRVLFWVGAVAAILALDLYRGSRLDSAKSADVLAYEMALLLFILGLIFGVTFASAFGPLPPKKELS